MRQKIPKRRKRIRPTKTRRPKNETVRRGYRRQGQMKGEMLGERQR